MGIIDKFDDTVRLNLRRFGLTALPLFSVTVALNAPLEVALLCGTSCSALALLGSRPAKIRPTVGRQSIARHSIYWRIFHPLPRIQR
jgi:hypothetical protein